MFSFKLSAQIALHLEVAEPGNLELPFFLQNPLHQFEHQLPDRRTFVLGVSVKVEKMFVNLVNKNSFRHSLP